MNKRKKRSWGLIIIFGVFALYIGIVLIKQQSVMYAQHKEMEQLQAKIEQENELSKKLLKQKEEVSSDEYIEKIARKKLGMVKNGERVFVEEDQ